MGGPTFTCAVLVASAPLFTSACVVDMCPAEPCSTYANINFDAIMSESVMTGGTLQVCWNSDCALGPIPSFAPDHTSRPLLVGFVRATAFLRADTYKVNVAAWIKVFPSRSATDTYTATAYASDGRELAHRAWTATYRAVYPSGRECDDSPCFDVLLTPE